MEEVEEEQEGINGREYISSSPRGSALSTSGHFDPSSLPPISPTCLYVPACLLTLFNSSGSAQWKRLVVLEAIPLHLQHPLQIPVAKHLAVCLVSFLIPGNSLTLLHRLVLRIYGECVGPDLAAIPGQAASGASLQRFLFLVASMALVGAGKQRPSLDVIA